MAQGRWKKYSSVNTKILEILRNNKKHHTTNDIRTKLFEQYNLKVHHKTLNRYLDKLATSGHILKFEFAKKNVLNIWKLKGKNGN